MDKTPDNSKSIGEPSPEFIKVQEFLIEQLSKIIPEAAEKALEEKPLRGLFLLYKEALNSAPTAESYKNLMAKLGAEIDYESAAGKEFFREFLRMKLPEELAAEDISLEKLKFLHAAREKNNTKMFLGFHVANTEYGREVPQSKTESVTIAGGKEVVVPPGNAHYSASEEGLYKDVFKRGEDVFLYFVEGSTGDFAKTGEAYRAVHESKGWVNTARKLPILFKTKLTEDVLEALGASQSK